MITPGVQSTTSGGFLFITSTAGGTSSEARSHVVRRRRCQKEKSRAKNERPCPQNPHIPSRSEPKHLSRNPISVPDASIPDWNDIHGFEKSESLLSAHPRNSTDQEPRAITCIEILPKQTLISLDLALQNESPDPFNTTAVTIDVVMIDLLQFSRQWYSDSKWSLGGVLRKQSHSTEAWTIDMRHAICSEAALYAALAVACHYAARLCRMPSSSAPHLKGLYYKLLCLRTVQEDIQNKATSPYLIQAVLDLAGAEFFATNVEAARLHLQAAKTMIDMLGGLLGVSESMRDSVGLADSVLSRVLLRKPVFHVEDWDPGPWEAQTPSTKPFSCSLTSDQALKTNFPHVFELELPTVFLRATFVELRATLSVRNMAMSINDPVCSNRTLRWVHIRTAAIYTGLLNHYLDSISLWRSKETLSWKAEGQLSAATCLAARYCHSLITYTPTVILTHFSAQKIYEELKCAMYGLEHSFTHCQNLALWLYFVGAVVEKLAGTHSAGEHEESQRTKFQEAASSLKIVSRQGICDVLHCFIYAECLDVYLDDCIKVDPSGF